MTDRQSNILTVIVAVAATSTAQLALPAIAATTLAAIGGNLASDAVRGWASAVGKRLGIRPLVGDVLLRKALRESFEQALRRLQNSYHNTPQYKASSEQDFIDTVFASLRADSQSLFMAATPDTLNISIEGFPLVDTGVSSRGLYEALDEYMPDASEHLRNFVAQHLSLFWASCFVERLGEDEQAWRAFQLLEWRELRAAVDALPHDVSETVRSQLSQEEPSAEWLNASTEALEQVAINFGAELSAGLDALNREVQQQGGQTREHVTDEADRIIGALHEGRHTRAEALAERGRGIKEMTVARLQVLGVGEDTARTVADRVLSAQLPTEISDAPAGSVVFLTGPLGAGKTTIAEALLVKAIEAAQNDLNSPIPVFLDADTMDAQLRDQIAAQCPELGDPSRLGVIAVLDGLDQVEPRKAGKLLAESIAVVRTWPATRIVITGRSDLQSPSGILRYDIPKLSDGQWESLAQEVAGHRLRIDRSTFSEAVADAVTRPLFAILLGIWGRKPEFERPPTVAALVRHLVEQSLNRAGIDRPELSSSLRILASRVIESGGRPARLDQVPDGALLRQTLLDTGIVTVDDSSRVRFALAIFAEWFAGQALLQDPSMLSEADLDRIMRWRYAVVAAVAAAGHEQARLILASLVTTTPAIAGWVISNALHYERRSEPGEDGGTSAEWADLIVNAMESWRRAFAPLAPVMTPSTEHGEPAAVGVRVHGKELEYGWSRLPGRIIELPRGSWSSRSRDWSEFGLVPVSDNFPVEWLFTWEWVRNRLVEFLRYALLRPPTPALQREYDWHVAQLAAGWGPSGHDCEAVPLKTLEAFLGRVAGYESAIVKNRMVSVSQVRDLVERHHEHGLEAVANPWPCSDQSTGWIPDAWSPERRLERLQRVCEAALEGYVTAVQRYFPSFQTQLGTFASMPIKLRGYLSEYSRYGNQRTFSDTWYLEPVPRGEPNSVEWIQVESPPASKDLFEAFLRSRQAHRPGLPAALIVSGTVPGLESSRPAMNLLATLLWRDFAALEWVSGAGPNLFITNYKFDPVPDSIYWAQPGTRGDKGVLKPGS